MAKLRITSMKSFTDEDGGTLKLIKPSTTVRPVNYWSVPRWWSTRTRVDYEHCARVDDTANGKSIYISSSTGFPNLLIEESGGNYAFDNDKTREHINRIFVTSDPTLQAGDDYLCPLRRGAITLVNTKVTPVTKDIGILDLQGPNTYVVGESASQSVVNITGREPSNLSVIHTWGCSDELEITPSNQGFGSMKYKAIKAGVGEVFLRVEARPEEGEVLNNPTTFKKNITVTP